MLNLQPLKVLSTISQQFLSHTRILYCGTSHLPFFTRFILAPKQRTIYVVIQFMFGGVTMDKQYSAQYKNLGLNISFYRKSRGYTQMELAELLNIDRSHMSAIELATVGVSLDVLFRLCEVLEVSPKELFDFRS